MKTYALVLGDIIAILLLTVIGFATHGEMSLPFLSRMVALFFPLLVSWFILAPSLGLFEKQITSDPKQFWRPVITMIFAAALAAILRGLLLNAPIIPIFGVVLGATSAFGMLVWRAIYWFLDRILNNR